MALPFSVRDDDHDQVSSVGVRGRTLIMGESCVLASESATVYEGNYEGVTRWFRIFTEFCDINKVLLGCS